MGDFLNIEGTLRSIFSLGKSSNKVTLQSNSGILEGKNFGGVFSKILLGGNNLSDVSSKSTSLNNLLPTQTGNAGKFIYTDGTDASWQNPSTQNKSILYGNRSTSQNITGGISTKVQINSITKDNLTEWDSVNFRWVSSKSQDIIITGCASMTGLANNRQFSLYIYVNGVRRVGSSNTNSNTGNASTHSSVSHELSVNTNDYIEVYCSHSDGSNVNTLTSCYLTVRGY